MQLQKYYLLYYFVTQLYSKLNFYKMTKKNSAAGQDRSSKNKKQHKQLFNELQTPEQQKIGRQRQSANPSSFRYDSIMEEQQSQDQQDKGSKTINDICENVSRLFAKNKITAKNAFQVPMVDLEDMMDFSTIGQNEFAWKKLSSTLQNDCKLFSLRVDAAHQSTFRILNSISRHEQREPQQVKKAEEQNEERILKIDNFQINPNAQSKFLQKNLKNINIDSMQYKFSFNPIFQRMKRNFDQCGLKGILLGNIQLDQNLMLPLNTDKKNLKVLQEKLLTIIRQSSSRNIFQLQSQSLKGTTRQFNIMKSIQSHKADLDKLFKDSEVIGQNYNELYKQVISEMQDQKQTMLKVQFDGTNQLGFDIQEGMDIQYSRGEHMRNDKPIESIFNFKDRKTLTIQEIREEQKFWINNDANIKRLLGIDGHQTKKTATVPSKVQKVEQEFINFDIAIENAQEILNVQSLKGQTNEQIEDKFLLPMSLFRDFKVQQILTLKKQQDEPSDQDKMSMMERQEQAFQYENVQEQIKRTQLSIRQSKQQISQFIAKNKEQKPTFEQIFCLQQQYSLQTSPALCFLTMLHLANQQNLVFTQQNDENFAIK